MLDSDDDTFVLKAIEEKATYHGRRQIPIICILTNKKVKDLVNIANHRIKQEGQKQIKSATTVWHRSAPRNKRSTQARRHKFKGLFCTKSPLKLKIKIMKTPIINGYTSEMCKGNLFLYSNTLSLLLLGSESQK